MSLKILQEEQAETRELWYKRSNSIDISANSKLKAQQHHLDICRKPSRAEDHKLNPGHVMLGFI